MAIKGSTFNHYSAEFKVEVVIAYLNGKYGGQVATANHFCLRSKTQLCNWVKLYKKYGSKAFMFEKRGRAAKTDGVNKGRQKKVNLDELTKDEQITYLKMENDILKKVQALRKR